MTSPVHLSSDQQATGLTNLGMVVPAPPNHSHGNLTNPACTTPPRALAEPKPSLPPLGSPAKPYPVPMPNGPFFVDSLQPVLRTPSSPDFAAPTAPTASPYSHKNPSLTATSPPASTDSICSPGSGPPEDPAPTSVAMSTTPGSPLDSPTPFALLSVDQLLRLEKLNWLLYGTLPQSEVMVLYGPSGVGKTHNVVGQSLCVASGRDWFGNPVTQGVVVYVAAEGVTGLRNRVTAWCEYWDVSLDEIRTNFWVFGEPINLRSPGEAARFIETIQAVASAHGPVRLVVFDTLIRCSFGSDENSSRDMNMITDSADRIRRETGATVLLVHHTGKAGDAERGSSALRSNVWGMLKLQPEPGHPGVIRLSSDKMRDAPDITPSRWRLEPVGDSCVLVPADDVPEPGSDIQDKIVVALGSLGPMTQSQIVSTVGAPKSTVSDRLKRLVASGVIVRNSTTQQYAANVTTATDPNT